MAFVRANSKKKTAMLWNHQHGWKNTLNNFRLIIQPVIILWQIWPWLELLNYD